MSAGNFQEFNKFQTYFYTDVYKFNSFTNFEIKRNSVMLLTNIGKGFPILAQQVLDIYSPIVKAIESPAIIKALQRAKFVNGFSKNKIPNYVYWKTNKPIKAKASIKKVTNKNSKKFLEFSEDIIDIIKSTLMYDEKDYQTFKYTDLVQKLGKNLIESVNNK